MPVGKKGRSSNGRKDVLGSRVNAVVFVCIKFQDNKRIPNDFGVVQIRIMCSVGGS